MAGWFYWGAAMVGRFAGSLLLTRIHAGLLLSACAMAAMLLALVVSQSSGPVAAWAALGIGLFNSVMFPTIFSLTLERSSAPASATSGLLVFGIIGGAALPPLAGWVADEAGSLSPAFLVPALAYAALIAFALAHSRSQPRLPVAAAT